MKQTRALAYRDIYRFMRYFTKYPRIKNVLKCESQSCAIDHEGSFPFIYFFTFNGTQECKLEMRSSVALKKKKPQRKSFLSVVPAHCDFCRISKHGWMH